MDLEKIKYEEINRLGLGVLGFNIVCIFIAIIYAL
jgi:hypothetical protein